MSTVRIPPVLRASAGDQKQLSVDGATVGAVLEALVAQHPALRGQLLEVAAVFGASVVDMSPTTLVLEAVSSPAKLDSLLTMLDSYGTCELVRTGRIALARGAGVITDEAPGLSAVPGTTVPDAAQSAA